MIRRFACSLFLLLPLAGYVHAQGSAAADYVHVYVNQCRSIQMVLGAREQHREPGDVFSPNDDFTVAGQKCEQLQAAISAADPSQIQSATSALRPILARLGMPPATPKEQLSALEQATAGATGIELEYALPSLAKRALAAGETEKAGNYAKQLLKMAPEHPNDWNYGNAIFYGNLVLGRIALQQGDLSRASEYLLASAATPGSPQLDSFGPNMTLAKELLEKGKTDVVLEFLAKCKTFWKYDNGKSDKWIATIHSGGIPDFGANLRY